MSQDLDQQVRKTVADFFRQAPRRYPVFSVVIVGVILILIIWFIPLWQVPKAGLSTKDWLHQINENRKTMAQIFGAGALALVGLYIAWVRSKAMRDQTEIDREQQLTDLYVKAIEQLGSEKLQIRLGGIYALERIARESAKDHWPIMEVLTAFVRENAPLKEEALAAKTKEEETAATPEAGEKNAPPPPTEKPPTDIQAVLTVLGRRARTYGKGEDQALDLSNTHLAGADLRKAELQEAELEKANLQEANLFKANLKGADLSEANLQKTMLFEANMQGANLWKAHLQKAFLNKAKLHGADLSETKLQMAYLILANLQGADLRRANLQGTNLGRAEGLTPEQMTEAIWDKTTKWPEGFSPPPRREKQDKKD